MGNKYKLGTSSRCNLMIVEKSISLEHAIITDCNEYIKIEDISRNGITIVRKGVSRKMEKHKNEKVLDDDILLFGFYEHPFKGIELFEEIKKLRPPIGSKTIRCAIHGILYIEGRKCPQCPD